MVGIPVDSIKIVTRGQMQGLQDWSTSVWGAIELDGGSWGIADIAAVTTDLEAYAHTMMNSIKGLWQAETVYTGMDIYYYPPNTTASTLLGTHTAASPVVGSGGEVLPNQCAIVATTHTPRPGRSGRGRAYFPGTGLSLSTGGQFGNTECSAVAGAFKTYLQALNAYTNVPNNLTALTAIVASFTKHETTEITSVSVDSIVDTQRRRRDKSGALHSNTQAV